MRLINVSTLRLEEFYDPIPPYAILSHTWGSASEEVTFREINMDQPEASTTCKPGYKKIKMCARMAKADKLAYCWVDTCCIDKTSSAELSEAINSMFRWYRTAAVCYIYLVDVSMASGKPLSMQVPGSRWFTRGWTLQELVAPKKRVFLDTDWTIFGRLPGVGDAESIQLNGFDLPFIPSNASPSYPVQGLVTLISTITGISQEVLLQGNPQDCPAAIKMNWASKRQTNRPEDMAYCLMGLFDVHMPLLYGEGERAFLRLQEEIIKKEVDHTIFTWDLGENIPRCSFHGLLSPSPKNFTFANLGTMGTTSTSSYEMTNNGLRIELPLLPTGQEGEYKAFLNITTEEKDRRFILLRKLNDEGQYARVHASGSFPWLSDQRKDAVPTWIYVKQTMDEIMVNESMSGLSRIILKSNVLDQSHHRISMAIQDVRTGSQFDPQTLSFPYQEGLKIDARILIRVNDVYLKTTRMLWWIRVKDSIDSRLALGDDPSEWRGSQWGPDAVIDGNYYILKIRPDVSFKVVRGALVAEVCLNGLFTEKAGFF